MRLKQIFSRAIFLCSLISVTSSLALVNPSGWGLSALAYDQPDGLTDAYTIYIPLVPAIQPQTWSTAAGNPQRTSWTPEQVTGNLYIEWYRPIEAFIQPRTQIVVWNGLLYLSTASGLYVLRADNGQVAWRYDTELPIGNSPTIANGIVYFGGYDRKLHALDALTGAHLWSYDGATAGYDTNPLVVDGKVILGNRDGWMYAIGAQLTPQQGQLLWKFQTGGPIHLSAAYQDGIVYFASNDNYAYALQADTGDLVWKSLKLPGDGFHSYWPVIFGDKVIFSGASAYEMGGNPGTASVSDGRGGVYDKFYTMEADSVWQNEPLGTLIGSTVSNQSWAKGFTVLNASRITQYLEANPASHTYRYKWWRRTLIVLNRSNGMEFTYDSDHDGYQEHAPFTMWGTHSGNRYPPIVGRDNLLYSGNIYQRSYIAQGRVMGWNPATPSYLSVLFGLGAVDEPYAISMGGHVIYRVTGDNVGDYFSTNGPTAPERGTLWDYYRPLANQAPGYDEMIHYLNPGGYFGVYGNLNGIYGPRGDENVLVPHKGRLFIHRSNAIIAYGTGPVRGKLPTLTIAPALDDTVQPTVEELRARLDNEIQKMIAAGHLRPGYMNNAQAGENYFENPGDTLYTLAWAYPYLPPATQAQLQTYLRQVFQSYFDPVMYSRTGWASGAGRESMPFPPELQIAIANMQPSQQATAEWSWFYPQYNFYAMWKYANIFPADAGRVYDLAKSRLQVPVGIRATNDYLLERTWELNGYIAGYIGFLRLQELAGRTVIDSQLRTTTTNELNRLLNLRITYFDKNSPWLNDHDTHWRVFNVARNFMLLVPELGDYLYQTIPGEIAGALDEYEYIAPFWFASRFESVHNEGVISPLLNYNALFQAKAYALKQPRSELTKYLDSPAFERGDLHYIQNLIAAIEAP